MLEQIPMPRQTRGGDVRNAPYPPVRAIDHLASQTSAVQPEESDGGVAA